MHSEIQRNRKLLRSIFGYLTSRHDLISAATSCKSFADAALDIIWASLPAMLPLTQILSVNNHSNIKWYAPRILDLTYTGKDGWSALFNKVILASDHLLPNLRRIVFANVHGFGPIVDASDPFKPPTLRTLEFVNVSEANIELIDRILKDLAFNTIPLQHIAVVDSALSTESLEYIGTSFQSIRSLQLLGVGDCIESQFLEEIGALPHLTKLVVDLEGSDVTALDEPIGFDALTSLSVKAPFSLLTDLPHAIQGPLRSLFITITGRQHKSSERMKFFKHATSRWAGSLKEVSITYPKDSKPANIDEISPFYTLDLTYFGMAGESVVDFSAEDVMNMTTTWPDIETLLLPYAKPNVLYFPGDLKIPPLKTPILRAISEVCPRLKTLSLPLMLDDVPSYPYTDTSDHRLETLLIANASSLGPARVLELARYIYHLFPHLYELKNAPTASEQPGRSMADSHHGSMAGSHHGSMAGSHHGSMADPHYVVKKLQETRADAVAEFYRNLLK